jgi:hypothetical protein
MQIDLESNNTDGIDVNRDILILKFMVRFVIIFIVGISVCLSLLNFGVNSYISYIITLFGMLFTEHICSIIFRIPSIFDLICKLLTDIEGTIVGKIIGATLIVLIIVCNLYLWIFKY